MNRTITKHIFQSIKFLLIAFLISSFNSDNAVTTKGNVSFTVKTLTYDGDRSPKNIVAIWIEDIDGNFIKTSLLQADRRKEWLITWNNKSGGSTVDATTGATLDSHQSHSISWDCTDESGVLVEDGEYKIIVEFTEEHSQGPLTSIAFNKGAEYQNITPDDESNFIDMNLEYTVDATGISDMSPLSPKLGIYPNPFTSVTTITFTTTVPGPVEFKVYGLNGNLLKSTKFLPGSIGEQSFEWDGKDNAGKQLTPGVYFLQVHLKNQILSGQAVKLN